MNKTQPPRTRIQRDRKGTNHPEGTTKVRKILFRVMRVEELTSDLQNAEKSGLRPFTPEQISCME